MASAAQRIGSARTVEPLAAAVQAGQQNVSTLRSGLQLLKYATQVDAAGFWLAVAVAFGASVAEGAGILLLLPLLSVTGMNLGTSSSLGRIGGMMQKLLQHGGVSHTLWLPAVLVLFLLVVGLRSVLRRWQTMVAFATAVKVELALSRRVYTAVVHAQWGFLVRQRAGRMTHVLAAELRRVAEAISLLLSILNLCCLTLLYFVFAFRISVPMTLVVLVIGGVLMLLQRRSLERVRLSSEELNESIGQVFAATQDRLLNMKTVKTYNAEERDAQLYSRLCNGVAQHSAVNARHHAKAAYRFEMGSLLALGGVIFLALGVLHMQAAAMLLLLGVFTRLMPQLSAMQNEAHQLASVLPSFGHVLSVEAECMQHRELPAIEADSVPVLRSELRIEGIWFAYDKADADAAEKGATPNYVLRNVDLTIRAGAMTALIGGSGAGKSTLADLANGLLHPEKGRVVLDGVTLVPGAMRQWRGSVGYVGQDAVLFHQSILENLLWASPDAGEEEIQEALTLASADFVYALPNGLETIVGHAGILLSSGQRQRISLARALLRRPSLLILDEATNALDVENEDCVLQGLYDRVHKRRDHNAQEFTVLMIAHRPNAIRRADVVVELENGSIRRIATAPEMGFERR